MPTNPAGPAGPAAIERTLTFPGPVSPGLSLAPLRRGPGDPCFQVGADGAIWRTSLRDSGPVTARITRSAPDTVICQAWGEGAAEFLDALPALLGVDDDTSDFHPRHPIVETAWRRVPHLRLGRTGRMLEALIPAILEQRVPGADAFRSWRLLVTKFGTDAPGPAPEGMRVPPSADAWRCIPSWEFHRANVDPGRARTVVGCAQRAPSLERIAAQSAPGGQFARARAVLTALPGVGVWTAAEATQRALGDADALSIGDYHLAAVIGWTLIGEPLDDAGMVELMEQMRPHRYRVVRLLEASGLAFKPRRGARLPVQRISDL